MITFDGAFDRLMGNEGGYVNDPADPGGETNWGISKRAYPDVDIKNLTRDGAKAIYLADFWNHVGAEGLPDGVVFQLFDFAVNSGIQTAIRHFQDAIDVAEDGNFGPVSKTAAAKFSEAELIMRILGARLYFMTSCSNWPDAGKGWARRIASDLLFGATDA